MANQSSFDDTYPFDEFCQHYDELQHGDYFGRDRTEDNADEDSWFEKSLIVVMEYMRERYDDDRERFFKGSRFVMIMNYLSHHLDDFDTSDYAVYGSPLVGALASKHLMQAVHHFFTAPELISENKEPTSAEVMALADSLKD